MRSTTVNGLNDNIRLDLGGDVGLIAEIIENGKAADALIYELELSGAELLELLKRHNINKKIGDMIIAEHTYLVTSYDW